MVSTTKDPLIIDKDELFETLIACLSHQNLVTKVTPMLRRLTGHNFGYQDTFQIRDTQKRSREQAGVLRKWHDSTANFDPSPASELLIEQDFIEALGNDLNTHLAIEAFRLHQQIAQAHRVDQIQGFALCTLAACRGVCRCWR